MKKKTKKKTKKKQKTTTTDCDNNDEEEGEGEEKEAEAAKEAREVAWVEKATSSLETGIYNDVDDGSSLGA